jgi:D-arabinose 1-dehydrogenase-like Zn-dependent alcohol dehydrogenase
MRAMVLPVAGASLLLQERGSAPRYDQIRVRVSACSVCRTDLRGPALQS